MRCFDNRRTSATSGFLLKIRHGCRTETLPDGKIIVSGGFDYRLQVDAAELTVDHLQEEFGRLPCSQNEEFFPSYYDIKFDNWIDVRSNEDLVLMWGTHLGMRTVLMSVHIVNKETWEEHIVNDCIPSTQ